MSLRRKRIAIACAVGVIVAAAFILPAIPGRPGPGESHLAELVRRWGGRTMIYNGLVRGIDLKGAHTSDDEMAVLKAAISRLKDPKCLREINLSDSPTGDIGIERLRGMEAFQLQLCLDHTRVTDQGLTAIADDFVGLKTLLIRETPVTEAGLLQLRRHPTLETVYIGGPNVTPGLVERLNRKNGRDGWTRPRFEVSQ